MGLDNTVYVGDFSPNSATVWEFDANLNQFTNQVLSAVGRERTGWRRGVPRGHQRGTGGDGIAGVAGTWCCSRRTRWDAFERGKFDGLQNRGGRLQ